MFFFLHMGFFGALLKRVGFYNWTFSSGNGCELGFEIVFFLRVRGNEWAMRFLSVHLGGSDGSTI